MKIAIDKNSINIVDNKNDYIYLYDKENLSDLLKLNLHCMYYKDCEYVDINLTDYDVECFKKAKLKDKNWNKIEKKDYKIGIIVPNYNYAHTLNKCIDSILNQTYQNFEIVYVDDMSTDNSIEIMQNYQVKTLNKIQIVHLKQKRLNGGARNEGLLHLSNSVDYVFYIDSDDWLLNNDVLEKINNKLQSYPDVLFMGLSQWKNNTLSTAYIPQYQDKYEALKGWSGCGKVIKKSLAMRQECLYNEGTLKEDKNHHCKICIYMKDFVLLKEPLYVWNRENSKSVTTIREKIMWGTSTIRHYADTMQLALSVKGQDDKIDRILEERLRLTKQEMESGGDKQW